MNRGVPLQNAGAPQGLAMLSRSSHHPVSRPFTPRRRPSRRDSTDTHRATGYVSELREDGFTQIRVTRTLARPAALRRHRGRRGRAKRSC